VSYSQSRQVARIGFHNSSWTQAEQATDTHAELSHGAQSSVHQHAPYMTLSPVPARALVFPSAKSTVTSPSKGLPLVENSKSVCPLSPSFIRAQTQNRKDEILNRRRRRPRCLRGLFPEHRRSSRPDSIVRYRVSLHRCDGCQMRPHGLRLPVRTSTRRNHPVRNALCSRRLQRR
jgi:hypothetical protein